MMLTPSIWSSIPVASLEESLRVTQTLARAVLSHQAALADARRRHVSRPRCADAGQENGPDMIFMAGGGMLGHPMGYKAGAMAFRQAIDAVMAGIPLEEAAQEQPEARWPRSRRGACASGPRRRGATPGRNTIPSSRRRTSRIVDARRQVSPLRDRNRVSD